jgi:predicted RNA-binding protein YlqC (UPF0109 family)
MPLLGPSANLLVQLERDRGHQNKVSKHAKEQAKKRGITQEQLLYGSGKNRTVIRRGGTIVTAYANNTRLVGCQIVDDPPSPETISFTKTVVCTTSAHLGHIIGKGGTTLQYLRNLLTSPASIQLICVSPTDNRFVIETTIQEETDCMASILETYLCLRDSYPVRANNCSLRTHLKLMSSEWTSDRDLSKIAKDHSVIFFRDRTKLYCLLNAKAHCFEKVAAEIERELIPN